MRVGSLYWVLILLSASTCQEIEYEVRSYPRMGLTQVTEVNGEGATFEGEILTLGNSPVDEHGFEWNGERVYLGETNTPGSFSTTVHYGIQDGLTYTVRCFAISDGITVYGDAVEFVGQGSESARINSFGPLHATWQDTVELRGQNFSVKNSIVDFGGALTSVIGGGDTLLLVHVPLSLSDSSSVITYRFGDDIATSPIPFVLRKPVIENMEPASGQMGTLVTITGRYFHPTNNIVRMGDQPIANTSTSTTMLKVSVLATGLFTGNQVVSVQSGSYRVTVPVPFTLIGPEITAISPEYVTFGETITITGTNLGGGVPIVTLSGVPAQVLAASATSISAVVPLTLTQAENSVEVSVNGLTSISPTSLKIKAPVITSVSPSNSVYLGEMVTIDGLFFHPTTNQVKAGGVDYVALTLSTSQLNFALTVYPDDHDLRAQVVTANQYSAEASLTTPLIKRERIDGVSRSGAFGFSLSGKGHMVFSETGTLPAKEVWTYNVTSNSWQRLGDFPGAFRSRGVGMASSGKAYYGLGYDETGQLRDWWEFNPAGNSWTKMDSTPFVPDYYANKMVVAGGIGLFFSAPQYDEVLEKNFREFWTYDPGSDTWTKRYIPSNEIFHDYQFERSCSFGIGGSAYFFFDVTQEAFRYDVLSDQWIDLPYNLPGGEHFDYGVTAFELGDRGYLLSVASFLVFDPSMYTWTFLSGSQYEPWLGGEAGYFTIGPAAYWGFGVYNNYAPSDLRNAFWRFDPSY